MDTDPDRSSNVLIVAAGKWAYSCYFRYSAYICQAGRSFTTPADRLGYYAHGAVQREFPRIQDRRTRVPGTRDHIDELLHSDNPQDWRYAAIIAALLLDGREVGITSQIMLLSPPKHPDTLTITNPIRNTGQGRGSAWTQGHRYVTEASIRAEPETTASLVSVGR